MERNDDVADIALAEVISNFDLDVDAIEKILEKAEDL
jgi:hypothetical protein